jgi:hypothetical protein
MAGVSAASGFATDPDFLTIRFEDPVSRPGFSFVDDVQRLCLERFRAKWIPVRVKKTRQIKSLESFTVSTKR